MAIRPIPPDFQGRGNPQLDETIQMVYCERIYQRYLDFERIFNERCSFSLGMLKFDLNQLYITTVYWSVFFSTIPSQEIQNDKNIANNDAKQWIAKVLPLFTFLYTLFSQICQQNKNVYIWLILFTFLFFTPLIVLIDFHLNLFNTYEKQSYDYIGTAFCILTILIFCNSLINRIILTYVAQITTELIATLASCSYCVLISYGIIFQIICFGLQAESLAEFEIVNSIKDIIATPLFLTLFFLSILILKCFFRTEKKEKFQLLVQQQPECSKRIKVIQSGISLCYILIVLIMILYIVLELFCYGKLIDEMSQSNINYKTIAAFAFLLIAIPIYLMLIDCIAIQDFQTSFLNLWIPLLLGGVSTFITVKIWNITSDNDYISSISRLIGICPMLISLIQLTVGFFNSNRDDKNIFVMFLFCYFFAFPLGFLLTLSDAFNDYSFTIGAFTLMSIGLIPFAVVVLQYIIKKLPKLAENLNFESYKELDLSNHALWINSIGYIISFHFLCYYVWNEPETATGTKKGTIQGLLILHTLLFLFTYKILQGLAKGQLIEKEKQQLDYIAGGKVYTFIILLAIALAQRNETKKNAVLSCAIGIPLVLQYFEFLLFAQRKAADYRKFIIPLIVIINWIFFISQIGVLFPILADYYENSTKDFAYFAQAAIAYTILIIIIAITCVSIFYSVRLNKDVFEMKRRVVLKAVMQLFANHRIYATEEICSIIFLRYIEENNDRQFINALKNGDPANIADESDDVIFKKKLVTKSELMKNNGENPGFVELSLLDRIAEGFFKILDKIFLLLYCSFCKIKLEEIEQEQKLQRKKENMELYQWRDNLINQNQVEKYQINLQQVYKGRFYNELQYNRKKTEIFWYCIYEEMKGDLSDFFKFFNLRAEQNILRQYSSYSIAQTNQLSIKDFAILIKDNAQEPVDYDYLWRLAQQKYGVFIQNRPELRSKMLNAKIKDSIFSQENFMRLVRMQNVNQRLPTINQSIQAVEEQYMKKKKEINEKYNRCQPSMCFLKLFDLIHRFLWVTPKIISKQLLSFQFELSVAYPEKGKIQMENNWQTVSDRVGKMIIEKSRAFDNERQNDRFVFRVSFTNILALILRLYDIYSLSSLAFSSQVGWFGGDQSTSPIETVDYSFFWNQYYFQFFFALFLGFCYIAFGIQIKKQIENNTFGLVEGQAATYRHKDYWLSKAIQVISGQFIFVMKTYIDAFICDYHQYPYTLVRQHSLECMSDLHFMYIVLAIFGCGIYYPLSTFLQPTLQYNDYSLDLKYKSSYLVLYIQSKLLILGLSSVFSNLQQESFQYQMLFSSIVMQFLIIAYYKIRPCYIINFNDIEFCLLLLVFYFYFGAFLIMVSKSIWPGWVIVIIFGCATILYTGRKYHQENPGYFRGILVKVRRFGRC